MLCRLGPMFCEDLRFQASFKEVMEHDIPFSSPGEIDGSHFFTNG